MSCASKRRFESGWCCATALILILLTVAIRANAALEEIRGFELISCGKRMCYELKTSYAERGILARFYYFEAARLRLWKVDATRADRTPGRGEAKEFTGTDGYYDPSEDRLVVRGISGSAIREVIIDLKEESETFYK